MSMSTGRWSDLSAEHEVRQTGDEIFWVIMMSKSPGIEGVL